MAAKKELTHETTSEEIAAFVDELAAERDAERAEAAEPAQAKTDAEIVSGLPEAKPETPAPKKGETAEAPAKGKGETEGPSWLDDDLKTEAAAYGIGEDELADFTGREEFERALRLLDKRALEAGRKAQEESAPSGDPPRDDKGRFTSATAAGETETKAPEADPGAKPGRYEIKLTKSVYDDGLVDELTQMRDYYEGRLAALEEKVVESHSRVEEKQFDSFVDALGHVDLFGKTDSETPEQLKRREELHEGVTALMLGQKALGKPVPMSEALVGRVARMVFADDLIKKEIKARTRRLSKQSERRQGGGVTRPDEPRESAREEAGRLFRQLAGL